MSGFEWDDDIGKAKLKTGKATQVYNHCTEDLIPRLDARREWTQCMRASNPNLPEILQPELQTEHYFKYVARFFVLRYRPEMNVWRLCFIRFVKDTPAGGEQGGGPADGGQGGPNAQGDACAPHNEREDKGGANKAAFVALLKRVSKNVRETYDCHVPRLLGRLRFTLLAADWFMRDALERTGDELIALYVALRLRRERAAASLTSLVRETALAAACAPRACARLEPRRVAIGAEQSVDLFEFVNEFDLAAWWNGWPFGQLVEQELAAQ